MNMAEANKEPEGAPQTPAKEKDPFEVFRKVRDRIVEMHGEKWFNQEASFMLQIVNGKEDLQRTTMGSRVAALLQLANTSLTLNPLHKHCYVISRSVKVGEKWEPRLYIEPSYMGLIKAATDTGSVKMIAAHIVYAGDDIDFTKGTTQRVVHVPYWKVGKERGEPIAAYSIATLHDGTIDVLDMGLDELKKVMGASEAVKKNATKKEGEKKIATPYDTWQDEMFRKAPIRRHLKTLPKTDRMEALMHALGADEAQFGSQTAELFAEAGKMNEERAAILQLSSALDFYQGEDKEAIRQQVAAKVAAKEFTLEYADRIMAEMGGKMDRA
jgi:phage RecT family recombinase